MQAIWKLGAPALNSVERTPEGLLSVSYTDNVDCRWGDVVTLGPLVTVIDCSAAGGTAANTVAIVFSDTMSATREYLYGFRGTKWVKIRMDTAAVVSDGTETALAEAATDAIKTTAANGTQEISIGMDNTAYEVITTVSDTATDTHSANNSSVLNRIFGLAGSDDAAGQIAGLGRSGAAGTAQNTIRQNVLSGTVTQDAPNWVTRATVSGEQIIFTGFALDGRFWMIGSSNGPYVLDSDGQRFRTYIDEIDNQTSSPTNCFGLSSWSLLGTIIPLNRSTRLSQDLYGKSIGPETYRRNYSSVKGRMGKRDGSELWDYWPIYNVVEDDTYICAVRPRLDGDMIDDASPVVFFPIVKLTDVESKVVRYAGTRGSQSLPKVYLGHDTDVAYFSEGRHNRFIEDSTYPYAASGTLYGTELQRFPDRLKKVKRVGFKTRDCNSSETVTCSIVYRDHMEVSQTVALPATTSNGWHWYTMPQGGIEARSFYPTFAFARGGTTTNSPKIVGDFVVEFELA